LRATCYDSSCDREHFFKKNGKLVCIMCLMREGSIKCQKCSKLMTSLGEMGKWRGNMFSSDGHTYDINNFGCECRECNHSESEKNKLKRCQGTFYVHYKRCCEGERDSMQFNQCDSAVPIDGGDFCQHCKDQTETYQQVKVRIAAEEKQERECERIVENIKLGKYWLGKHWVNRDVEGYCSGGVFGKRVWGQEINDNSDNSVGSVNAPPSNSEPKNSSEIKISLNQAGEPKNNPREKSQNETEKGNNQTPVINLKDIKKISLVGDNLVIEFNQSEKRQTVVSEQITNNQELLAVKNYLRKNNQTSLSQQELNKIFSKENNNAVSTKKPHELNNALLIGGGVVVLIIGVGIISLRKKTKLLTDEQLQNKFEIYRKKIRCSKEKDPEKKLNKYLVPVFALMREAIYRKTGLLLFPTQIFGGIVLHYGVNLTNLSTEGKKQLYNDCTVIYTTGSELGFDYLRNNLITSIEEAKKQDYYYAIADEIDSLFIDECTNPLIISQRSRGENVISPAEYQLATKLANSLTEKKDYKAKHFYHKDIEYIVDKEEQKLVLIDTLTGRLVPNRVYSSGIHQAIESKENLP
ncbi:16368_t:CDS:2, partial [Funneliformis geosporum]